MQQHTVRYDLQYNEGLCAWVEPCLYQQAASDKTWQNATQKRSWMEEFDGLRFFMGLPLCLNSIKAQINANVKGSKRSPLSPGTLSNGSPSG